MHTRSTGSPLWKSLSEPERLLRRRKIKFEMEEVQAAVLNTECSLVIQNGKLPPKLDDPDFNDTICELDDDLFNELDELIMKVDLDEIDEEKEDVNDMTVEEFGKWIDEGLDELETISPMEVDMDFDFNEDMGFFEALEKEDEVKNGMDYLEMFSPNKVNENSMVKEEFEVREKPPDLDELYSRGIIDFIDKFVAWLMCRKDESLGKVGVVSFYKKKCKGRMEHVMFLIMLVILACTRKWKDAIVKFFEKLFVANQFCVFDDYFYLDNSYHGLS